MLTLKTPKEIEVMAEGGRRLGEVLKALEKAVRPGVKTIDLDRMAHELIVASGAKPAFLHYRPEGARKAYPFTLCTSLNDVVVHGQPSGYALQDGDIVKLDLGLNYKGWYLDSAVTVAVGKVSREATKLMTVTKKALDLAIKEAVEGNTLGDVGSVIHKAVTHENCSVVEGLVGHGIGKELHEDPAVFNFGQRGAGEILEVGMVLAIEPMVALGKGAIKQIADESYATRDGSLAAQCEHTVAITEDGPRILTLVQ